MGLIKKAKEHLAMSGRHLRMHAASVRCVVRATVEVLTPSTQVPALSLLLIAVSTSIVKRRIEAHSCSRAVHAVVGVESIGCVFPWQVNKSVAKPVGYVVVVAFVIRDKRVSRIVLFPASRRPTSSASKSWANVQKVC